MFSRRFWMRLTEFFVMGLILGIIEDLLAIRFATDSPITWRTVGIVFVAALPFAVISEFIVDSKRFNIFLSKIFKVKNNG